jgi:hypothetical protein
LSLGVVDTCAVTAAVVGCVVAAVCLARNSDPTRVTNDEFEVTIEDDSFDDDGAVFDANPFVTRQPKASRLRKTLSNGAKAASRYGATQLGAAAGVAFGVALSIERRGCMALEGDALGFLGASTMVQLAAAWPLASRLTARGVTPASEHKLWHLIPMGAAGAIGAFWIASALSLDPTLTGVTRTATSFAMVLPATAFLNRFGLAIGEPLDIASSVFAAVTAVGAGMAMWEAATAAA